VVGGSCSQRGGIALAAPAGRSVVKGVRRAGGRAGARTRPCASAWSWNGVSCLLRHNAYIPDFLDQTGRHNLISHPTGADGAAAAHRADGRNLAALLTGKIGFVGSSVLMAVAQLGIVLTPGVGVCSGR